MKLCALMKMYQLSACPANQKLLIMLIKKGKAGINDSENKENKNIAAEELINSKLSLEQKNLISQNELMTYRIREKVTANKPKLKQQTLIEIYIQIKDI